VTGSFFWATISSRSRTAPQLGVDFAISKWAEVIICPAKASGKKTRSRRGAISPSAPPAPAGAAAQRQPQALLLQVPDRSDPEGGSGLDLIRWHRGKAVTIEHAREVRINKFAGATLPSDVLVVTG
jgi:hypothetical protein